MGDKAREIRRLPLTGTDNGMITVAVIDNPYGPESSPVASIGVFMNSDSMEPDWKVHLPKEDINGVIDALREAREIL